MCWGDATRGTGTVLHRFRRNAVSGQPVLRWIRTDIRVRRSRCPISLRPFRGGRFGAWPKKHTGSDPPRRVLWWFHQPVPRQGRRVGQTWVQCKYSSVGRVFSANADMSRRTRIRYSGRLSWKKGNSPT